MGTLTTGLALERAYVVTEETTAKALLERDGIREFTLPPVWSTPDMIGKMEGVAAALVAGVLEPGQMTVGAHNDVAHLAATPAGMTVRVQATLTAIDGRKLTFAVTAHDERDKVGEGTHVRFIVDRAKFLERLAAKRGGR